MWKTIFKLIILSIFCYSTQPIFAQVECSEFYLEYDSLNKNTNTFHPIPGYEHNPRPEYGYKRFYKIIDRKSKYLLKDNNKKGKILLQFVIDTLGNVHCPRVIESDIESLNSVAIMLIEDMQFIPAERHGKRVISTMILPIFFEKSNLEGG